jgi:hypothetical protein
VRVLCVFFFLCFNLLSHSFDDSDDDDDDVCPTCLLFVVRFLEQCGCEIERSAYRTSAASVIGRRRRLNLDEHFLNLDDLDALIRFRRNDFAKLCACLLPADEWIVCKQGTKAHRNEAVLYLLLDMSHPHTLQQLSHLSSSADRRSPQEISLILNTVRSLLYYKWRKFVYLWPGTSFY